MVKDILRRPHTLGREYPWKGHHTHLVEDIAGEGGHHKHFVGDITGRRPHMLGGGY